MDGSSTRNARRQAGGPGKKGGLPEVWHLAGYKNAQATQGQKISPKGKALQITASVGLARGPYIDRGWKFML